MDRNSGVGWYEFSNEETSSIWKLGFLHQREYRIKQGVRIYCIQVNKDVGLLHTDKQKVRVYAVQRESIR